VLLLVHGYQLKALKNEQIQTEPSLESNPGAFFDGEFSMRERSGLF
jgi:hypothetical protein